MTAARATVVDFASFKTARHVQGEPADRRLQALGPSRPLTEREVAHRRDMLAHLGAALRPIAIRALS